MLWHAILFHGPMPVGFFPPLSLLLVDSIAFFVINYCVQWFSCTLHNIHSIESEFVLIFAVFVAK
jgi:hypothetical protein